MRRIFESITILAAVFALSSCLGDNYPAPGASLYGQAIDAETGEPVLQDLGSEGSIIQILEHGYENASLRYLNFKTDGSYCEKNMFDGHYTISANRANFVPIEEFEIDVKGDTKHDFLVTPYCRINVESIELVEEKQKVYATFTVERTTDDALKEIALFCDPSPQVSCSINNYGDKTCKIEVSKKVSKDQKFTIKMPLTALDDSLHYYFRVGARSAASEARWNYAPAQQLFIAKKEIPKKEVGIVWDVFKHFDYWTPHKTIGSFVWDEKDFKTAPGCIAATSMDQGGPGYTQFITPGEDSGGIKPRFDLSSIPFEGCHMLLTIYISEASHFERSANGQIEISSDGIFDSEEISWTFADFELRNGWQTLDLSLPEGHAMGSFRMSKLNWFRMYHLKETGPTVVKFDEIRFYYKTLVDACESETDWNSNGSLSIDEGDCKEGEGCVSVSVSGNSFLLSKTYANSYYAPAKLADGNLRFWIYVSDADLFNSGEGSVEVSSAASADTQALSWSLPKLTTGWNLVAVKLSDAEQKGGEIDLRKVNFFRICKPALSKSGDLTVKVDGIRYYKDGYAPEDED